MLSAFAPMLLEIRASKFILLLKAYAMKSAKSLSRRRKVRTLNCGIRTGLRRNASL